MQIDWTGVYVQRGGQGSCFYTGTWALTNQAPRSSCFSVESVTRRAPRGER